MKAKYDALREAVGKGQLNLQTADIRLLPIRKAHYTPNFATHRNLTAIPSAARGPVSGTLPNKQVLATGWPTSDKAVSTNTEYTDEVDAIVLYLHTGTESTSILLYFDDEVTGLPTAPSGDSMEWSFDGTGIFRV